MELNESNVYFARKSKDVKLPTKREEDGCYDLYAYFEEDYIEIKPHTTKLIPTGVHSAMLPCYRIALRERGSNTKWHASIRSGQIDSGYRGEIWVAIHNDSDIPVAIKKNIDEIITTDYVVLYPYRKAICQFAVEYVPQVNTVELELDELINIPSCRGTGDLGSSGK
jgi:dUTP pyrophosphatase